MGFVGAQRESPTGETHDQGSKYKEATMGLKLRNRVSRPSVRGCRPLFNKKRRRWDL